MKKIVSVLLVFVMLVGCVAALSACSAPKDNGASINIYLGNEVFDFDPSDYYADSTAEQVMALLYEPLFKLDEDGNLELAMAAGYEIDYENREIVIEIRESYWSDDVRVKANDFVYAWCDRLLNPNNPNPAAALLYEIENAMDVKSGKGTISDIGVRATGVYELTINYREGADYDRLLKNLASVATAPLRQDIVDTAPTYWSKMLNTMVFCGPFKVRTYNNGTKEFSLIRNVGYHQSPDAKNFMKYVTPGTLYNFFTPAGEEITVSASEIESKTTFFMTEASLDDRLANKDNAKVYDDTSVYTYVFNLHNPLFQIPEVREALLISIDRTAIKEALVFAKAADGFVPDICGGSSEVLISSESRMEDAEELLAGVNFNGISKSFTIKYSNNEMEAAVAELVAQAWSELGFYVTAEPVGAVNNSFGEDQFIDSGIQSLVKEASFGNRDFDVLAIDWQFYTDDAFVGLSSLTAGINGCGADFTGVTEVRENIAGYVNTEYDSLVIGALKVRGDERAEMLAAAEKMLVENAVVCPIVYNQSFALVSSELKNVEVDGLGNFVLTSAKLKNYEQYLKKD